MVPAVSVAVALLVGVGLSIFPATGDDLHLSWPWRGWLIRGDLRGWLVRGEGPDWDGVRDFAVWFFNNENRRLANFVMMALAALPRWVAGMLSGLAVGYIVFKGAQLVSLGRRPLAFSLWTAAIVLGLPWYDQLYLIDFQLNYTWAAALMLAYAGMLLKQSGTERVIVAGMFVLALVLGVWHEGFGVPCLLATVTLPVLSRRFRTPATWAAIAGLAIGSAFLMITPVMAQTMAQAGGPGARYFSGKLGRLVYPYLAVGVAYFLALGVASFSGKRNLLRQPLWAFASVVVAASFVITCVTATGPRAFTPGLVFGWLGIVACASLLARHPERLWRASAVASALIFTFLTAHLVYVDVICARLQSEYRCTIEAWRADPTATAFVPMTSRNDVSWLCVWKPHYNLFSHRGPVAQISRYYFDTDTARLAVPEQLAGYTPQKAVKIPGDARATAYEGYIVGPWLGPRALLLGMCDSYGMGEREREYYYVPFRSRADNRLYGWFHPDRTDIDVTLRTTPDYLYTRGFTIEDWQLRKIEAESGHLTR